MRNGLPALGGGESSGQIRMSTHLYSKRKVCNPIFIGYKLIIRGCDKGGEYRHYIPQVYLRGFSPDYRNNEEIPYDKYTICCYDTTKIAQMPVAVPIKSICYSKLLYEVTGADGEIVLQNHLEKCLCSLENMIS